MTSRENLNDLKITAVDIFGNDDDVEEKHLAKLKVKFTARF